MDEVPSSQLAFHQSKALAAAVGIPILSALAERTKVHLEGKRRAEVFEILPTKRGEVSEGGTKLAACGEGYLELVIKAELKE